MAEPNPLLGATPLPPDPKKEPPKAPEKAGLSGATIASGVAVAGLITLAAWPGSPAVALLTQLLFPATMAQKPAPSTAADLERGRGSVASLSAAPQASGADSTALFVKSASPAAAPAAQVEALAAPAPAVEQSAAKQENLRAYEQERGGGVRPAPRPQLRGRGFSGLGGLGRTAAAQPQGGGGRAGVGVEGLPPALMNIGMREMASHPEVIPVQLKLVEYSKKDDQTGGFREAMSHCGSLYTCKPNGPGKTRFTLSDGLTVDYTYMRGLAWGLRNHFIVTSPTGERAEFSESPLVLDLKGEGFGTRERRVNFDLDGDGRTEFIHAPGTGLGLLVFGSGKDGRFLFGNRTDLDGDGAPDGYADGFEALEAFVARAAKAGVISQKAVKAGRLGAAELAALNRVYDLRVRDGFFGRERSPQRASVVELRLSVEISRLERNFDDRGDDLGRRAGASFKRADGTFGDYADLWLRPYTAEGRSAAR